MTSLTSKDLEVLSHLLAGEELACKKAKIYSNTLMDIALAEEMENISRAHAERFNALLSVLGGKE